MALVSDWWGPVAMSCPRVQLRCSLFAWQTAERTCCSPPRTEAAFYDDGEKRYNAFCCVQIKWEIFASFTFRAFVSPLYEQIRRQVSYLDSEICIEPRDRAVRQNTDLKAMVDNHIVLFSCIRNRDSFCHHKMETGELPFRRGGIPKTKCLTWSCTLHITTHIINEQYQSRCLSFLLITLFVYSFWRHVIRSANKWMSSRRLCAEKTSKTKVSKFNNSFSRDENVSGFYVWNRYINVL